MADPIDIIRHIRVGGRTMCGLKLGTGTGVHAIPYLDVGNTIRNSLCKLCYGHYEHQLREASHRQAKTKQFDRYRREAREERDRFSNSPRMR